MLGHQQAQCWLQSCKFSAIFPCSSVISNPLCWSCDIFQKSRSSCEISLHFFSVFTFVPQDQSTFYLEIYSPWLLAFDFHKMVMDEHTCHILMDWWTDQFSQLYSTAPPDFLLRGAGSTSSWNFEQSHTGRESPMEFLTISYRTRISMEFWTISGLYHSFPSSMSVNMYVFYITNRIISTAYTLVHWINQMINYSTPS